ncbi:MAG: amidase family protein [Candidatus Izemoplasmatales bacterium]
MKEYSLRELEQGLNKGKWTSVDLVDMYLERIYKYDQANYKINSIAEINPEAYQIAKNLDLERKLQGPRSKIHGIPIVIKDNIITNDYMHTSASSIVFEDFYADEDAFIIKKLREAGAIILGKANLSEFAYFMSFEDMPSGYGSRFGQVKSPYSKNIDPLGSSTGSAVAVACNFIPVSIGTETNGSLTAPSLNNSVNALKPSLGLVSRTGIIPISINQDTAGPLARTVEDLAIFMEYFYGYDEEDISTYKTKTNKIDFLNATKIDIKNKRIGFINFTNLNYNDEEKLIEEEAKARLKEAGVKIVDIDLKIEAMPNHETLIFDFKVALNKFMSKYMNNYKVNSLKDIIKFNKEDPDKRLKYGQSIFEAAEETTGSLREKEYNEIFKENLAKANLFNQVLLDENLDCLVSVKRTSHAPIAGNPVVSVVAKALVDESPKNLFFIGKHFSDDIILSIANQYELRTNHRLAPDLDRLG